MDDLEKDAAFFTELEIDSVYTIYVTTHLLHPLSVGKIDIHDTDASIKIISVILAKVYPDSKWTLLWGSLLENCWKEVKLYDNFFYFFLQSLANISNLGFYRCTWIFTVNLLGMLILFNVNILINQAPPFCGIMVQSSQISPHVRMLVLQRLEPLLKVQLFAEDFGSLSLGKI